MTRRRLLEFIDALAEGRRPKPFSATPEEIGVMRAAVDLRAARPGDDQPDPAYVERLHAELSELERTASEPVAPLVPMHRRRAVWASVAAALVLVGVTAAVTTAANQAPPTRTALPAPNGSSVRTGTFETTDGRVVGQVVAYRGSPSWVFMNVGNARYSGVIVCKLQMSDGSTVATGTFLVHAGEGTFSKSVHVDFARLRDAELVTPSGKVVASATLSA